MRYLLLFLLLTVPASAQKEYSRWYFGAGFSLDFNAGSPPALSMPTTYTFEEGSAGICNPTTGDLLFYTNGVNVIDRQHTFMPNGDGINVPDGGLKGDPSSSQS